MCGIAGIVNKNSKVENSALLNLNNLMFHRGPDEDGFFIKDNVGISMRRLSILGLANGSQPFFNRNKNIVIVGNGEIYNFQTLKKELIQNGITFNSNSDMEIIPHLFEIHGIDFINMLDGMFGLAILDLSTNKLILVRDFHGVKPLYYSQNNNHFVFSSDQRAIIKSELIDYEFNYEQIPNYLNLRLGAIGKESFFKNINMLPQGSFLEFDCATHTFEIKQHFSNAPLSTYHDIDPNVFEVRTHELLRESVKKRLISEVPVATFLSSGIDSTIITGIAAELTNKNINCYTVGYDTPIGDESAAAAKTAEHLGIKHKTLTITANDFYNQWEDAVEFNEAPISHPNSIAIKLLTAYAKNDGIKVILSGEGADEIFGGYKRFEILQAMIDIKKKYGTFIPRVFNSIGYKIGEQEMNMINHLSMEKLDDFVFNYFKVSHNSSFSNLSIINEQISKLATRPISKALSLDNILNDILIIEQNSYMHELLLRQDKMSMYSSVEVRVPFVDKTLIRYVNSINANTKIVKGSNKYYLRKMGQKYLSKERVNIPKQGFSSPIASWMKSHPGFQEQLNQIQNLEFLNKNDKKIISKKINNFNTSNDGDFEILWKLMNLNIFMKKF